MCMKLNVFNIFNNLLSFKTNLLLHNIYSEPHVSPPLNVFSAFMAALWADFKYCFLNFLTNMFMSNNFKAKSTVLQVRFGYYHEVKTS